MEGQKERLRPHGYGNTPSFSFADADPVVRVVDVHDGDTIKAVMEAFPGRFVKVALRVAGIDCCEITSRVASIHARAVDARNRVLQLVTGTTEDFLGMHTRGQVQARLERDVYLARVKIDGIDKYGRVLADVYVPNIGGEVSIAEVLLRERHAMPYDGGHKIAEQNQIDALSS